MSRHISALNKAGSSYQVIVYTTLLIMKLYKIQKQLCMSVRSSFISFVNFTPWSRVVPHLLERRRECKTAAIEKVPSASMRYI